MAIILSVLIIFVIFVIYRLIIGPSLWDRLLCLSIIASKFIMILVVLALYKNETIYLDIAILYVVLGFIGTTFMAIFIQKRGRY